MSIRNKEVKTANGARLLLGYLGLFLMVESIMVLLPLFILIFYPSESGCWMDFVYPAIGGFVVGALLASICLLGRKPGKFLKNQESVLLIFLWLGAVTLSAFPFFLAKNNSTLDMSYLESFFEAMSGYSTTGLTVYSGFLDQGYEFAHVFLFHRAMMQFIGGVGLVLVVTSVISDKRNVQLFNAEGHGDHLLPSMGKTAQWIFGIYIVYIAIGTVALYLCGMDLFEAFCHSVSCLATGGFSTRSGGLLYWQVGSGALPLGNQIAMEIIFMILMLLGSSSFVMHFLLFTLFARPLSGKTLKARFKSIFMDFELKFAFFLVLIVGVITTFTTMLNYAEVPSIYNDYLSVTGNSTLTFWESFRYNIFYTVSCVSTTGYANAGVLYPSTGSLAALGDFAIMTSVVTMAIGGAVGSTAGGIKQYRFGIALNDFIWNWKKKFSTNRTVSPKPMSHHGEKVEIDDAAKTEAYTYASLYIVTVLIGSCVIVMLPYTDFRSSLYNFSSALSTLGLSVFDFTVAGYGEVHSFLEYKEALASIGLSGISYNVMLVDCTIGMLFARLEIMVCIYAVKGIVYDPFVQWSKSAAIRGHVFVLKEHKTNAIKNGDFNKAEALTLVLSDYDIAYKLKIEEKGTKAKMRTRDIIKVIEGRRDKTISCLYEAAGDSEHQKYSEMIEVLNEYLPNSKRKKI